MENKHILERERVKRDREKQKNKERIKKQKKERKNYEAKEERKNEETKEVYICIYDWKEYIKGRKYMDKLFQILVFFCRWFNNLKLSTCINI